MKRLTALAILLFAPSVAADDKEQASSPDAPPTMGAGIQGPKERSRRNTAYTLPRGMWALDLGVLSAGGDDVFARLGATLGVGAGLELDINLGHYAFGLFNFSARWQFFESKHFAIGASLGFWYAHGDWLWIYTGVIHDIINGLDIFNIPAKVTASFPIVRWLQADLGVQYRHSEAFGTIIEPRIRDEGLNILAASELAMRQVALVPSVRVYLTDAMALETSVKLPLYSSIAVPQVTSAGQPATTYETLPFWRTWTMEVGLRSRLARQLFASLRFQYAKLSRIVYESEIYPSFDVELRL